MTALARIWARYILAGKYSIDQAPEKLQPYIEKEIEEHG